MAGRVPGPAHSPAFPPPLPLTLSVALDFVHMFVPGAIWVSGNSWTLNAEAEPELRA